MAEEIVSVPLVSVTRIVVFVHPGQLKQGVIHLITLCDADPEYFAAMMNQWSGTAAICLYDGPPVPPERR